MPRELYDVMLEALRERGAVRVDVPVMGSDARVDAQQTVNLPTSVTGGSTPSAPTPPTIADVVAHACVRYAYGSRDEEMANRRIAYEMTRAGQSNSAIIATLRDGASLPAWADTL